MPRVLYRGACPACGWHGRIVANERSAEYRSARHMVSRKHNGLPVVESAPGPRPSPWSWVRPA